MRNKFLLFACIFAYSITAKAQYNLNAPDTVKSLYQQHADSLFQYLDKSVIATNILYDRVAQFADLDTLSKMINNNTNPAIKTSSIHFLQAWKELYDASYNQSNLLKPGWIDALIIQKRDSNIVPIGVLNYRFNVLDSQAVQKNLIYLGTDSLLHDVAGRTQIPYYTRDIFLASPLLKKVNAGTVTFQFASLMLLQNNPVTITSLYIDFGGGQSATLLPGGTASVNLENAGTNILTITANFSNSTQKIISATLEVEGTVNGGYKASATFGMMSPNGVEISPCIPISTLSADLPFADYTTSQNKNGVIQVGYYFANCATPQLHKPIIILDGFDPGDDREVEKIYGLLYYDNDNSNFGEEMRQQGYDVIIVNFPNILEGYLNPFPGVQIPIYRDGGADYIERNALAVVKLIQSVNQQLINNGSTEELIIVGPSMGGLITRYALAYMEKNSLNHNTRLWVSFDSPHGGANIPIGDQYWLEYYKRVAGNKGAKASLDNKIGSVAARQMLLHHWTAQSVTPAPNVFRAQFMQNLQSNGVSGSNGFPNQLRKVALTNGSGYGAIQPEGTACGKVLHLDAYIRNWIFVVFPFVTGIARHHITESNVYFTADYGNNCKVFGGWWKIGRWGNKRYEEKSAKSPFYSRSYDRVPGGKFNTQKVIKEEGEKTTWLLNVVSNTKFSNVIDNHSFIPTVSALALTNQNSRDWSENLSSRNLICTNETPFDDYFTPIDNEDHVFLSTANVVWIKNQINTDFQNCVQVCDPISIFGDNSVCNTTSNTYTLNSLPAGAEVLWEVSPSNIATPNTPNLTQTTLTKNGNGVISLTATITNSCTNPSTTKKENIIIGKPKPGSITFLLIDPAIGKIQAEVDPVPGATSYNWYKNGVLISGPAYHNNFIQFPISRTLCDIEYDIAVAAINSCGTSSRSHANAYVPCDYYFVISPNPATNTVTISSVENKTINSTKGKNIEEIKIYDNMGNLKKHSTFKSGIARAQINVSGLPTGVYFIEISNNEIKERKQLIIQK